MYIIVVQVLAIPVVMLLFQLAPRWLASILASLTFITVAVLSLKYLYTLKAFRSYGFWVWMVFLYALVIPILVLRLSAGIFYSEAVEDVYPILGLLHRISSPYYMVAMAVSVYEVVRNKKSRLM